MSVGRRRPPPPRPRRRRCRGSRSPRRRRRTSPGCRGCDISQRRMGMGVMGRALTALVIVALLAAAPAGAQTLPRIDGPLTLEQAVDLALQKNLRVKAAGADARAMDSMRRETIAPFWPQLSAHGYFADHRMGPNVSTSAGTTMARNYQVFNSDQTRDGNFTAMYPLFSGGRDWYGYKAAVARDRKSTRLNSSHSQI